MNSWQTPEMAKRLAGRHRAEKRFRAMGLAAIVVSLLFLAILLVTMLRNGIAGLDWSFLTGSDSTDAASAGVWGAVNLARVGGAAGQLRAGGAPALRRRRGPLVPRRADARRRRPRPLPREAVARRPVPRSAVLTGAGTGAR